MSNFSLALLVPLAILTVGSGGMGGEPGGRAEREQANKTMQQGNYKDAYETFRKLALDPQSDPLAVGQDVLMGVQCLQQLNRTGEVDAFIEAAVAVHKANWRLLWAAAQAYMQVPHQGFLIAGKFERGPHRGGGQMVSSVERDRVRAMQLMVQALPLAQKDADRPAAGQFFFELSQYLLNQRGYDESWRLQYLTDLAVLPDYEPGWGYGGEVRGAPVDEQGKPIFHYAPKSWEDAKTDGQRWRWCLVQTAEADPARLQEVRMHFAEFLHNQFDVQTMAFYGWFFGRMETDDTQENESGVYAIHTLKETETIARLASGIKRFDLPDEFNFIKLYQQVAEEAKGQFKLSALVQLATIFENRRQYPRAAEYWKQAAEAAPAEQKAGYQERLRQIVGNWFRIEPVPMQAAGQGASLEVRFRNGKQLDFTAEAIDVAKLLDDVKAEIKSKKLDWESLNLAEIGYRLVIKNQRQYLTGKTASWRLDVEPREKHFDKRVTVATPLQKAGAYLITAKMADGNTQYVVLWVADTAIVKKALDGRSYYFVADARSGRPVAKANMEFFGWRQNYRGPNQIEILTKNFALNTDADGQAMPESREQPQDYQWLVIARTDDGRLAYHGFSNVWYGNRHDPEYNQVKVFSITDRPVYRPSQPVHYKFWVRRAQYDRDDSEFAGRQFTLEIHNPKGEKVVETQIKADAYGGFEGKYDLPADATLGVYGMMVREGGNHFGGGNFRVEEYKKPEYEVTVDAPAEPVMLGEKITATITAKYYFGSPVTKAKVKYKVLRTDATDRWYPVGPWDWLYGSGYWWFGYDYDWYPGWRDWGCPRPVPFWFPRGHQPPEVVADREIEIGPDGTVKVEIDTAVAKAIHPHKDHQYAITAEVVDESRRTIVGTGNVLVSRKPFSITAWVDRGYYRVGDVVAAHFAARRLDGKPVQGKGQLTLLWVTYKDGKPVEKPIFSLDVATNEEGVATQQIKAGHPGQYRLSYKLTDAKNHTIEGGYVFTIIGPEFKSETFRFNDIELVPDKKEYQPDESVKMMVNADRADGTVLLFLRPTNGVYLPPKVIRLQGKSAVEQIAVVKRDMPNFFVEAVTVADGRVYSDVREVVVPPEKRVLNVEVQPTAAAYKPGQKAQVKLKLTDFSGEPFEGSTVVAIYDKSIEYISGGTNVPEIKAFFWNWRRHHHPQTESTLGRMAQVFQLPNTPGMMDLGVFGATVADDAGAMMLGEGALQGRGGGMGGMGPGATRGRAMSRKGGPANFAMEMDGAMPMMAPAAAAPMAEGKMAAEAEFGEPADKPGGAPNGGGAPMVQPTVRKQFADTALWVGALTTGKDGTAEVSLNMPENLTTWRIKVWGMGHGTRVGEGQTDVVTRKDLIVRLQAPRFFVQKDEVVLSANVHNYLKAEKAVQVVLELEGKTLQPTDQLSRTVKIPAGGEARVDWRVKVLDEGEATVRMKALTDEESDAMEQKFPCYVHGMLKMEAFSGVVAPDKNSGGFKIAVPAQRRPKQTRLEVRYSPTLAGAMVDALPYLVDYPYGCTEQTLNRFLPTVITQKVLLGMGLDLKDIQKKRTNLNAQEIGDDAERAKQWKRYDRNPVFDEDKVRRMVRDGVERLVQMQLSDGGWGWFSGYGEHSEPHTTALVVHGLQMAKANDVALVPGVLERGVAWLKNYQSEQVALLKAPKDAQRRKDKADNLDAFVYMVLVDAGVKDAEMHEFLYRDRTGLAVYALAMYGLAVERLGDKEKLDMVLRNIGQYLQQDDENQTAWLNLPEGNYWWCWYGSEYEAHAYYLKLLARTDPKGETARRLVKYLLNNRKHATYWNSTRDTAIVVEAFAEFLKASGEQRPEMSVEVVYDGKVQKGVEITPATLFTFDNKLVLEGEAVTDGAHAVELRKKGAGPLYFNGYLTNFTLEDPILKAGLEIKVVRKYYRLKKVDAAVKAAGSRGQVVDQKVEKYEREELKDLADLKSGELVEIELEIASKNDYEYIVFEDMKPAGFEPVDVRSGYTGNAMGAYTEFRDNRVAFFVRALARGNHSVSYRMRAEIPGKFSALPTRAWAMYAPELKANSDEIKLQVHD